MPSAHMEQKAFSKQSKVSVNSIPTKTNSDESAVLSDELETNMRLLGVTSVDELRTHMVNILDLDQSTIGEIPGFRKFGPKL